MHFVYCLLMTAAAGVAQADEPTVEVFLPPGPGTMNTPLMRAREVVEKIYAEIGVRVIWRSTASRPAGCSKTPLHQTIVVALAATTPEGVNDFALAYSNPFATKGPCVTLFMDRLQTDARTNPDRSVFLIAHVLAHEMGHVLQRISRHSESGVMKRRWSLSETSYLSTDWLHFSSYDAELILQSLTAGYQAGSHGKTGP